MLTSGFLLSINMCYDDHKWKKNIFAAFVLKQSILTELVCLNLPVKVMNATVVNRVISGASFIGRNSTCMAGLAGMLSTLYKPQIQLSLLNRYILYIPV